MSKKKQPAAAKKDASYYNLHTEAVEDLVTATKENTPRYSEEELTKYRSGRKKWKLPQGLKAVLIKFWFYGAVCFFGFMGLGMYLADGLDMLFVGAVLLGMVTDLLINHFLRFTEQLPGGSKKWMMVTRRGAAGFFMNLLYGFVLMFLVYTLYVGINAALLQLAGGEGAPVLGVEPILFGLFTTGMDSLCVGCRNLLQRIVADARKKA